jgi:dTMP kinase
MTTTRRGETFGYLISVEGIEGAGKSSLVAALAAWLRAQGREVASTAEPDGTLLGTRVRELFAKLPTLDPLAECLLFAAARVEHVRRVIRPALERGAVVVCDRYADSTVAYQGYGRGVDLGVITELNRLATDGVCPHLTIILDLDVTEGIGRARQRAPHEGAPEPDPFERLELDFHERVRKGYRAIHEAEPERVVLIDAARPEAAVARAARAVLTARLGFGGDG